MVWADETTGKFPEYVGLFNYPLETHKIKTTDGYILTYFRIQAKGQASMKKDLPVMYLQHGLVDSSDGWVVNARPDENMAPAFYYANQGFDVWLGNMRGNDYSKEHETLSPEDDAFWDYSFHEMAVYDLPAAFQYIHDQTHQMINYIGHSQGTMVMHIALALKDPIVAKYLQNYAGLASVAFIDHQESTLISLTNNYLVSK